MYLKKELYELIKTDESIFDFIQEGSLDGLWYWDLENPENEWMNAKFWRVLGYDPDDMPHSSRAWQSIVNQEDLKIAVENFVKHCEDPNHPYDQIVRYRHKDGSTVWIRCRGLAIRDTSGKPLRMLGAHQDITELKTNELSLLKARKIAEESDEKYRAMYNNAPLSYQSLDENGCFIDINPMWLKTLGYEKDEVIGKWFGDFLHPDYVEHFGINFPAFKKRGYVSDVQFRLRRKDNTYIYVSFEGCVGYTPEGKFKLSYCVFKDITEQKSVEQKLQNTLCDQNLMLNNDPTLIYFKDCNNNIIRVTESVAKVTGLTREEIEGRPSKEIYPDMADQYWKDDLEVIKSGNPKHNIIEPLTGVDGSSHWLLTTKAPVKNDSGEIVGICVFATDITDLKNAELELIAAKEKAEESEQRFKSLIENAPDGVVIIDESGKFTYVSPNAERLFGYAENEAIGRYGDEYTHPDDLPMVVKTLETILADPRQKPSLQYRFKRKNGEFRWIETTFTNLLSDKAIKGIVLNFSDVTERKQIFEELLVAKEKAEESEKKYRLLTDFAADVVWVLNLTTEKFTYISPSIFQLRGFTVKEAMNEALEDSLTPESLKIVKETITNNTDYFIRHPDANNYYINEIQQTCKNGELIWVEVSTKFRYSPTGDVEVVGVSRNIDERKEAESALKNRENLLNKVFDILPIGLWFADKNGKLIRGNPAGVKIWGAEPTVSIKEYGVFKARRLPSGQEIEPEDWALAQTILNKVTIEDEELEIDAFDGKKKIILNYTAPVLDDKRNIEGAIVVNQDITQRKMAENALKAKIHELERFHKLTVGRELTMVELKKEVNSLLNQMGQDSKYKIVE